MTMNLTMSRNDSLVYDLVFENKTEHSVEQMAIIYEGADTEAISIAPKRGVEISAYYEEDVDMPNCKAIILHDVKPNSKIEVGQLACSKKNSGKFLYRIEVQNDKKEKCSNKMAASMNKITKKSAEGLESIDNKVSNISIAPNPAKDMAELHFTATEQGNTEIIVVDILGNQLLRISDYIAYPGANSLNINLSNFSGGVYNVIVKTISGVSTQKFSVVK